MGLPLCAFCLNANGKKSKEPLCNVFSSPESKAQDELLPSVPMRRASSVNFLHFHLLENTWSDFSQTWQESWDSKLFKWYTWPPWGPGGERL